MERKDFIFILRAFVVWRVSLFLFQFIAIKYVPLQRNFLGGGMVNYVSNPYLWSWVNFDGEHFLSIAQIGYQSLTYFFFPLYPLIISLLGRIFGRELETLAYLGIIVSNLSFLVAMIGLWKLIILDFDKKIATLSIVLMLVFPTSFFFASFYSESLFLALAVWSFYFARKEKWLMSSLIGGMATATRLVGIALFACWLPEFFKKRKYVIFLMPLGAILYMLYIYKATGDALNFLNTVSIFGPQRSSEIILLPQVFYRYIFKIIPNFGGNFIPLFEFGTALLFLFLAIMSFWKLSISHSLYLLIGYLIPSFSGSFSSLPRYVLVLFPAFVLMAIYIEKLPKTLKYLLLLLLFIGLFISTMMFTRGVWIS